MLKNGKVDTTYNSATRNYTKIDYSESIKYLPNYEFNLIDLELSGDVEISLNTNFSSFNDIVSFYFTTTGERTINFVDGFASENIKITKSCFIDFWFDGSLFVRKSNGLKIGDKIKDSTNGGLLFIKDGELRQDSGHFFYDHDRKYLGIGNDRPTSHLTICGSSNNGQMQIFNNTPDNESSIGFGKYGESPLWLIGSFNEEFCLKNTKTGKTYILSQTIGDVLNDTVSNITPKKSNKSK